MKQSWTNRLSEMYKVRVFTEHIKVMKSEDNGKLVDKIIHKVWDRIRRNLHRRKMKKSTFDINSSGNYKYK